MSHLHITEAVGKTSDYRPSFKLLICCKDCRSQNVSRDGAARWSVPDQVWELSGIQDQGYCDDCGGEARLVERHVDMDGNDAGPVTAADLFGGEQFEDPALPPSVDRRELATIIAALRFWQREGAASDGLVHDIASDGETLKPLGADEIDALCERLNQ